MKPVPLTLLPALGALAIAGASCGAPEDPKPTETDARAPAPAADPEYIDFLAPEAVIAPGTERMTCTHFAYEGEDTAFFDQQALQGKFGHHAILLTAKEPKAPGTVEDCTNAEDMARYDPFSIPESLPDGKGVFLRKGHPIVLQSHYVNTGRLPLRVRDVVRLRKRAVADVREWVSMFVTNSYRIDLPPGQQADESFDCTLEKDVDLLLVGGHMHEWGTRFEVLAGPDADHLSVVHRTEPWVPEYRDTPPVKLLFSAPLRLAKGSVVRTTCRWKNDGAQAITFPQEMCSTFAYVAGTQEALKCFVEKK